MKDPLSTAFLQVEFLNGSKVLPYLFEGKEYGVGL